jgi:hypothetical protein
MFLQNFEQPVNATISLLKRLKVKVTNNTINKTLHEHPDYPSFLSINDVLNQFNVNTAAINVEKEKIKALPLPFIAHVTNKGGGFVTVTEINDQSLTYYNTKEDYSSTVSILIDEFTKICSGNTILAEATENAGEQNYTVQRKKELLEGIKIPILFICLLACGITTSIISLSISYSVLVLLKFIGVIVSTLLLWYEVDKTNTTLQKICAAGTKTNCNAILNSKQAKLLGVLSWSEIGFYYFTGSYLVLLISGVQILPFLTILNFCAIPYILFSVYYQWRIAKQWCVLCLTVQAILFTEGITNFSLISFSQFNFTASLLAQIALSLLVPVAIWLLLKPALLQNKELQPKAKELVRLKANPKIFESLLIKQKQITIPTNGLGIFMGNPNAKHTIIKVCNPYCGPCAKEHPVIEEIIHSNPNIKVQVLFTATSDENDKRNKPVKHLLAIQEKYGSEVVAKAMDNWYNSEKKDYDAFADEYPMNGELEKQNKIIENMNKWCREIDIQFTPTFFINGYQLPDIYSIGDIKYLLD